MGFIFGLPLKANIGANSWELDPCVALLILAFLCRFKREWRQASVSSHGTLNSQFNDTGCRKKYNKRQTS
jgi:hypothetical protein